MKSSTTSTDIAAGTAGGTARPVQTRSGPLSSPAKAVPGDDYLIAAAAAGDRAAWSALVERYLGRITGHAWYMLGDPREAEDVAQETFLRLLHKAPEWSPEGGAGLGTWLYRVAVNLCIDRKRKHAPHLVEQLPEFTGPVDGAVAEHDRTMDVQKAVREALSALPERQRAAVVLSYYEGFTNREAGEILGISTEAVESLLARGRRALKAQLGGIKNDLIGEGS